MHNIEKTTNMHVTAQPSNFYSVANLHCMKIKPSIITYSIESQTFNFKQNLSNAVVLFVPRK